MSGRVIIAIGEKADGNLLPIYVGRDASAASKAVEAARTGKVRFERAYVFRNPFGGKRITFDPVPSAVPLSSSPPASVSKSPA